MSLGAAPADATLVLDVPTLLTIAAGRLPLARAGASGVVRASGDLGALADFPRLFESGTPPTSTPSAQRLER